MKSTFKLLLFLLFSFIGMQVPQVVENYKISASAVVSELEGDYNKVANIAKEFNLTIDELMVEAKKTNNIYAQRLINVQEGKIPRYLTLKAQVDVLNKTKNIFTIIKVVFFEHDPAIWQNVIRTYQVGLYLNLDAAWYWLIFSISILLILILDLLLAIPTFLIRRLTA